MIPHPRRQSQIVSRGAGTGLARAAQTEDDLLAARQEFDLQLRPYRGKMNASQIAMLEKQFLDRRLLESARLPRLSLFYLR